MPPANSPNREPTATTFISALRGLERAVDDDVLNLAATLTTQVGSDRDDGDGGDMEGDRLEGDGLEGDGLERLRTTLEHDQQRLELSRERLARLRQLERSASNLDLDQRDRLQRSMDRLTRLHEAAAASMSTSTTTAASTTAASTTAASTTAASTTAASTTATSDSATTATSNSATAATSNFITASTTTTTTTPPAQYGERVPSQNSLYDWSPLPAAQLDTDDARSLRALQSRLHTTLNPTTTAAAAADSLRSTAILQAVRRHPSFSARTRDYLQRYTHDRDRDRDRDQERHAARDTATLRRSTHDPWAGPRERYQATRTPHLQQQPQSQSQSQSQPQPQPQPHPPPPPVAPMLEHTVKYLSRIRHANTVDESLNCALEAGFLSKDYFCIQYADFLTDTLTIPPPQHTSWLAPGAVLSGCQHATTSAPTSTLSTHLPPPSRPWLSTAYATPRSLTSYLSPNPPARTEQTPPHQDRWPVKVTIHAVDWSAMSLSATMEAYNVPSHPHQHALHNPHPSPQQYTRTSSITTYLEGEMLDFNTHTLLTESFKSSPANDALYWRKLPPFRDMDDQDVVRALTSRKWWEGLSQEWVLMRWKERCFVKSLRSSSAKPSTYAPAPHLDPESEYYTYDTHPFARHHPPPDQQQQQPNLIDAEHAAFDDSGCGLTISGFYFVCLRRCDGSVEGLYYDPMSSPYQCLRLESEKRARFASWAFA